MALENVITSLVLDVIDHDQTQGIVKAIALDSKTRYVKATIVQHGIDYPVDENATVTLTILRPDNAGVQVTGSVVDVDNADRTGTIKGVYAELSQTALALKGNLKAQFMVSVGDQILRTEIFTVKNGEALDADVSEWAGEYQGYNLDELVESVNSAVETVTGMQSTVSAIMEDLSDIEEKMSLLSPIDLSSNTTFTEHKYVNYANGNVAGTNNTPYKVTDYIDLTGITTIIYSKICTTASSGYQGIAFYEADKTYISGVRVWLNNAEGHYEEVTQEVPDNAKYIRLTFNLTDDWGDGYIYDYAQYADTIPVRLSNAEQGLNDAQSAIAADATHVKAIEGDSYYTIPADKWVVGDWGSYSSTRERTYRVRCTETLYFDVDTIVLADEGYSLVVIYEDGTGISANYAVKIAAGKNAHIYSRRISENTSEVITDITPFVSAIKFTTAFSPINIYAPTFTDVSMFERVGIGGDSYSAGGGIISGIRPLTWGKNLERQAGITVDIYAKSGENVVDWNADTTNGLPALLAGTECGLYWLWHGINGTSSASLLGTPADMSANPHPNTFYGQYVEAIEQIKATFPNARIVLATVTGSNYGLYQSTYKNANTAIKNIAEFCSIPCIDVADDAFYKSFAYSDNIRSSHPTAMVAAGMAHANRRLIAKCILDNPDYFIDYGSN